MSKLVEMIEQSIQIEAKLVEVEVVLIGEMAKEAKAESYQKVKSSGKADSQRNRITQFLADYGPHSRRQIEERLQIRASSVSARLNELVADGLVAEVNKIECEYTQMTVVVYGLLKAVKNV